MNSVRTTLSAGCYWQLSSPFSCLAATFTAQLITEINACWDNGSLIPGNVGRLTQSYKGDSAAAIKHTYLLEELSLIKESPCYIPPFLLPVSRGVSLLSFCPLSLVRASMAHWSPSHCLPYPLLVKADARYLEGHPLLLFFPFGTSSLRSWQFFQCSFQFWSDPRMVFVNPNKPFFVYAGYNSINTERPFLFYVPLVSKWKARVLGSKQEREKESKS